MKNSWQCALKKCQIVKKLSFNFLLFKNLKIKQFWHFYQREICYLLFFLVKDKYNQLMSQIPELKSMAQRGEDFLYFKHMQGNAPHATLLMEMLHAKKR